MLYVHEVREARVFAFPFKSRIATSFPLISNLSKEWSARLVLAEFPQ